ncbi:MAG: hypothetical protein KA137_10885, partial [Halioglobus sp.]|nr:hypothetical protein [Halioglobus sp.]
MLAFFPIMLTPLLMLDAREVSSLDHDAENFFAIPAGLCEPVSAVNTIAANNSPTISAIGEARIGPLMALPRVLEEAGISAAALFREAGIAPDLFDHPDNR